MGRGFLPAFLVAFVWSVFAAPTDARADVRVWTDQEQVILKGDLKGLEILPSGAGASRDAKPAAANPHFSGRVLRVGRMRKYNRPGAAAWDARDGDIIEIDAGTYVDCATWRANDLVIRGVGGRAHVRDKMCAGKAIWITQGRNITIENIEFSGMRVPDRNGAGIRHEGAGLTVRDSWFHDGEQGILGGGAKPGDVVIIENSRFVRLGRDGQAHGIYIGRADRLVIRGSLFRDCSDQGHCVKSLAKRTEISCSVIASLEGDSSYEIDLPAGGQVEIRDNVIQQGARSENHTIIAFATSAQNARFANAHQTLILHVNTVINDRRHGGNFLFVRELRNTRTEISGNLFVGPGKLAYPKGNKRFPTRAAAGLPPSPALPEPPACRPGGQDQADRI